MKRILDDSLELEYNISAHNLFFPTEWETKQKSAQHKKIIFRQDNSQFSILSNFAVLKVKVRNKRNLYLHPFPVSSAGLKELLATGMLFTDGGRNVLYTVK